MSSMADTSGEEKVATIIATSEPSPAVDNGADTYAAYLERKVLEEEEENRPPTPAEKVDAWRAWLDSDRSESPPKRPTLADVRTLPWPRSAILAKQWFGRDLPAEIEMHAI